LSSDFRFFIDAGKFTLLCEFQVLSNRLFASNFSHVNATQLNRLFLELFDHQANEGQERFFGMLADFIYNIEQHAFVLRGYAGTGKTSVVRSIVRTYIHLGGTIILLTPTGRAAKVLSQRTGQRANTIHRYIYAAKNGNSMLGFGLRPNLLKHALFVVDEAGMIGNQYSESDVFGNRLLLDDLVDFVRSGHKCKLLFIGDDAQLPPIGLEISPALDARHLHVNYNLEVKEFIFTQVVRQAQESGVLRNATMLRTDLPATEPVKPVFSLAADFVRLTDPYEMEEVFQNCFADSRGENGLMIVNSNKRANQYNMDIRARIQLKEEQISSSDQLMVVRNNYYWLPENSKTGFIANGDTLEVLSLRNREELYGYNFIDATVQMLDYPDEAPFEVKIMLDVLQAEAPALPAASQRLLFEEIAKEYTHISGKKKLAEAVLSNPYYSALQVKFSHVVTCHKSQGGQWPTVLVEQPYLPEGKVTHTYLRWLYTAITRAEKKVYLIGFDDSYFDQSDNQRTDF